MQRISSIFWKCYKLNSSIQVDIWLELDPSEIAVLMSTIMQNFVGTPS